MTLTGTAGTIPASAIDLGYVSYRLSRVTSEGTVYTIAPRLIMAGGDVEMPQGLTRRFWMTVKMPARARPGLYKGTLSIRAGQGETSRIPLEVRVRAGTLLPVDIPAGPFGYTTSIPWYGDDPQAASFNQQLVKKSLQKMREYGFTACSGLPSIAYRGFSQGKPVLDFAAADASMKLLKDLGFLGVSSYGGGVSGFDAYYQGLGRDGFGGVRGLRRHSSRRSTRRCRGTRRSTTGFRSITIWPMSRSAMSLYARPRMPRSTAKPFRRGRRTSRGQQLHREQSRRSPFPAGEGAQRGFVERSR